MARGKPTFLSELFSVEVKFTIDIFNKWFKSIFKSKFLKLNEIQKQIFVKEDPSKIQILLDTEAGHRYDKIEKMTSWYDFIIHKEHLFIRNNFSREDILSMKKLNTLQNYYEKIGRFFVNCHFA